MSDKIHEEIKFDIEELHDRLNLNEGDLQIFDNLFTNIETILEGNEQLKEIIKKIENVLNSDFSEVHKPTMIEDILKHWKKK